MPKRKFSFYQIVPIDCPPSKKSDRPYSLDGLKRLNLSREHWGVYDDATDSMVEVTDDFIMILCDTEPDPPVEWARRCVEIFTYLNIQIYYSNYPSNRSETHTIVNNTYVVTTNNQCCLVKDLTD